MTMLLASARGSSPDCWMYPSPIFSLPCDHNDQCNIVIKMYFSSVSLCVFSSKIPIFVAPQLFLNDWPQNGLVWMWEHRKVRKSADIS